MKNTSKTIIFFGTDDFSLVVLKGLIESGYNIAAVVTKPDSKSGRGQRLKMPSVKMIALKNGIAVWQPDKISDINETIIGLEKKATGVLASFGKIIPESTINLFNPGIVNIHPSLLPKYRGPIPIESAILNGDKQTGISIMQLTPDMDAGPIYIQTKYNLTGDETSPELYQILAKLGAKKLLEILPSIIDRTLKPSKQNSDAATYCSLLTKSDSILEPQKLTATEAERKIRAHISFPKTKFNILEKEIIITKSHIINSPQTIADIACKNNTYLSIDNLIAPSGRKMSIKDFLNGCRQN